MDVVALLGQMVEKVGAKTSSKTALRGHLFALVRWRI